MTPSSLKNEPVGPPSGSVASRIAVAAAARGGRPWSAHAAIPLTDAPHVTTVLAWPPHTRSRAVAGLVRTAAQL
ncbi:hypothetical protein GCM10022251_32020 [Phytohabitans flavus]|uniref:Uncharacterized protein n=1 Tax=Phytohabitans flavus TaxID=1076124 RepID=A0A6F8XWI4_9ACTN|nr:hypothetical protein Pflav_046060 [Phytohabitans flavus]